MVTFAQARPGIFAGESGGDYNALYNYQNREGGRFAGTRLTDMSVGDVTQFTDPRGEYAQYVRGQVGRTATPVGAYQVVGTTLRDAVNALGIDPSTPFNQATQDRIGEWIFSTQGTGAWEGYRGPQAGGQGMEPQMMLPQGLLQQQPQTTDPFEGLSRNQRMMLGFSALRDAAASLEGRDTSFFNDQLGVFEGARERERLRVQGATQNRIQGLQALAQVQQQIAMYRALGQPVPAGLVELERAVSTSLGGAAGATGGVAPQAAPQAAPQTVPQADGRPVSAEAPQLDGPMPQSSAAILAEINRLSPLVGVPSMEGVEPRLAQLQRQYDTALAREEAATEAQAAASEREAEAQQAEFYSDITQKLLENPNLGGVTGGFEGRVNPESLAASLVLSEDEEEVISMINQLQGANFLQARDQLRGTGTITDFESRVATDAMSRLSNRRVGDQAYRQALLEVQRVFQNAAARAKGEPIPHPEIAEEGGEAVAPQPPNNGWTDVGNIRIRLAE